MPSTAPVFHNVIEAIGNTPLHEVTALDTGPCRLFLKLENQNPGGSIKDRIGRSMIEAAERDGLIAPGGTIVEATAGNTGLALALVARQKGYRMVLIVPDKMAQEKVFHLRAMGADVITTRSDVGKGHPEYYQDMAERLAGENGWYYINQFANPANPHAHETTTGPEILAQCEAAGVAPDAIVCGVGSGGTATGLSRFFATARPETQFVLADPEGSILGHYIETGEVSTDVGSWLVEGIGEDFVPPVADLSRVKTAYSIPDRESFQAARELLRREGVLGGSSTGTLLAAALRHARRQTESQTIVTFVCDSGNKYLSKMFNDFWMIDNGFMETPHKGDLTDLVARKFAEAQTVTVKPSTGLDRAYRQMKLYDISQLPVLEEDRLVGILDEEDLLAFVCGHGGRFDGTAADAMSRDIKVVDAGDRLTDVLSILRRGMVAPVVSDGRFQGLITKTDVLNHLRLHPEEAKC
ncbi:pyridoxal-phosphate dependent enzyme [Kaustia mangrovi]|uniref:Cysteine synthase B n=1 Tax=Kaustia mangrovi TaxID=2593653 RepID=A0A7S8HDI0_9HYPH|nr:pyridoxal-phosphate dependent enzyme [Kaustia mangrovi]QPC44832.1 pyridoxal-phosphate dependent enzyme [Kaustia mangrovi]